MFDLQKYRCIDLTMSYQTGMRGFDYNITHELQKDGWNARNLQIGSHAGTHMDAPFHFEASEQTIDEYPLESLMGKAWVVGITIEKDQELISVAHLGEVANQFQAGESLLLKTGWSRYVREPRYRNGLPRISEELAEWCVKHQVKILGVEAPSVADVNNLQEVTKIHLILLGGGVVIVEGLCNLERIQNKTVWLMALPLKIYKSDGAPARVIAFEEKIQYE